MNKIKTSKFIIIGIFILLFVFALVQIRGYFLTSYESKYVTSALFANSFWEILKANINGINVFEGGPLYFLLTKLFINIFGSSSEFIVRLPIVLISFITAIIFYLFCKNYTNKNYATISLLTFCLNISFLTFSSVSIPQILAANFALLSVLFGIAPLFFENLKNKHLYFIGFWFFIFLVVYTDLFTVIIPVIVIIISYLYLKKFFDLLKPINFILGFFSIFLIVYNWQIISYKVSENFLLFDYLLNSGNFNIQPYIYTKFFIGLFAGLMPWSILFIVLTISLIIKSVTGAAKKENISSEEKFLAISICGFLVSSFIFFLNHSFSNVILATSFAAISVAYSWYKYIYENYNKKVFNISSSLFFGITLLTAVSVIVVYFFIDNSLKLYFEPLLCPMVTITLLVSIPGLIVVMLDRKWLIYSAHLLFSIIFYFILTVVLFDYINSFGESELITYAYGAKDNVEKLVTYDIKNKFVIPYYFGNIVEFNDKLSPEEIFEKYGDTYDVRIITKIKNLEDFDNHFVYELLDSGKSYCVITNIKPLPETDKAKENK